METTPIEVLEHHVEKLEMDYAMAKKANSPYRCFIQAEIIKFEKAIIELKNIELCQ